MEDLPRTATVICKSDTLFLNLSKQKYQETMELKVQSKNLQENLFLQSFDVFQHLNFGKLAQLRQNMKEVHCPRSHRIYCEHSPIDNLYFIKEGEVQLSQVITQMVSLQEQYQNSQSQ